MRLAAAYIRSMLKNPAFYFCILVSALISFGGMVSLSNHSSVDACFNYISFQGVASQFGVMTDISTYRKFILIAACIPFNPVFSNELKSGYTKSAVMRSSRKSYLLTHAFLDFFFAFIVSFLGMLLCAGIMSIFFPLTNEEIMQSNIYVQCFDRFLNYENTAWIYIILKALFFSVSLGAWAVSGAAVSAIFPDPFAAICAPLVMSYVLEFFTMEFSFLPSLWNLSRGYGAISEEPVLAALYIIFVFMLLGGIFGAIFFFISDRRLKQ
jgi:hypothetical protein